MLRELLIARREPVVNLIGPYGSGKTSIAKVFAGQEERAFPGGIFFPGAFELFDSRPGADAFVDFVHRGRASDGPTLVVLDSHHPIEAVGTIRNTLAGAQILLTTTRAQLVDAPTVVVQPLSQADLRAFIERTVSARLELSPSEAQTFIDAAFGAALRLFDAPTPRAVIQSLSALYEVRGLAREQDSIFAENLLWLPDGAIAPSDSRVADAAKIEAEVVSDAVLEALARNPDDLYTLSPRRFEEVIAEVLARDGYDVTLTAASRDGGVDLWAVDHRKLGKFVILVECKRYAPDRPVGVGVARQLYGVVRKEGANAGVVASTSFFTRGAQEFAQNVPFELQLQGNSVIRDWIKSAIRV